MLYLCCGSGSAWIWNYCLDPNMELKFPIRIQQKIKEHINKTVKSELYSMFYWTVVLNREWQIVVKTLLFDRI